MHKKINLQLHETKRYNLNYAGEQDMIFYMNILCFMKKLGTFNGTFFNEIKKLSKNFLKKFSRINFIFSNGI